MVLLEKLGLSSRIDHRPGELSAGEKQRTALARAFLKKPELLLADEPTGNLDPENSDLVLSAISDFQKLGGTTIMVTHGKVADQFADKIVHLREGHADKSDDENY